MSPRRVALERAALLGILERVPWTHSFDQSFQDDDRQPRGECATLHYYASILCRLPRQYTPRKVWVVSEPHPTSGRWHAHGFWHVEGARLYRGWWREAKEWLGEWYGWARVRPFAACTRVELAARLAYPTGHAVKKCPTTFWRRMALIDTIEGKGDYTAVRYSFRGSWWSGGWKDGVMTHPRRET